MAASLLLALAPSDAAHAQETPPRPPAAAERQALPTAGAIVERYRQVMGAEQFAAVQSVHSTGQLAVPAAGLTGTLEIWQARPNRTYMHASVPGYGDLRTGFTGTAGWSLDPVEGPRVLAGAEATQAQDDAHFDSHLRVPELIDSMATVERTTLGGHDCYKVRTVWKSGRQSDDCYSVDTGLLVGSRRVHQGSSGPVNAVILYEEYRRFGDIRMPTRITTQVGGVDQIITLSNVTLNSVDDSAFEPPPEIVRLLGG